MLLKLRKRTVGWSYHCYFTEICTGKNHQVVRAAAILRNKWERDSFVQKLPENDSPDTSPGESQFTITTNPKRVVYKIFIVL